MLEKVNNTDGQWKTEDRNFKLLIYIVNDQGLDVRQLPLSKEARKKRAWVVVTNFGQYILKVGILDNTYIWRGVAYPPARPITPWQVPDSIHPNPAPVGTHRSAFTLSSHLKKRRTISCDNPFTLFLTHTYKTASVYCKKYGLIMHASVGSDANC